MATYKSSFAFSALALSMSFFLIGCGVSGNPGPFGQPSKARFIDKSGSGLNEAEFQQLAEKRWKDAQTEIAIHAQFDFHNPPRKISDPDPEAYNVDPVNVTVVGVEDVPAAELNALPDCQHCPYADPSGWILAPPNNLGLKYTTVWLKNVCTVVVPESHPEYMGPWEFSNCILAVRGRDVSWRLSWR